MDTGTYICAACGETVTIPVDPGAGRRQEVVEDCPICCRPNELRIEVFDGGEVSIESELEQF